MNGQVAEMIEALPSELWKRAIKRAETEGIQAEEILPGLWRTNSASDPNKSHYVGAPEGKIVACDCVWIDRMYEAGRDPRAHPCKHMAKVSVELMERQAQRVERAQVNRMPPPTWTEGAKRRVYRESAA